MKMKYVVALVMFSLFAACTLWAEEAKEPTIVKGYVEVDQAEDDGTIQSIGIWNSDKGEFVSVVVGKGQGCRSAQRTW